MLIGLMRCAAQELNAKELAGIPDDEPLAEALRARGAAGLRVVRRIPIKVDISGKLTPSAACKKEGCGCYGIRYCTLHAQNRTVIKLLQLLIRDLANAAHANKSAGLLAKAVDVLRAGTDGNNGVQCHLAVNAGEKLPTLTHSQDGHSCEKILAMADMDGSQLLELVREAHGEERCGANHRG